ncbi:MAG: RNA polymerase sigma-70 factor [Bacteroidetes bacterium]|nr:RNA polymerase sigma-70 factor [Bacteroidota bacterium]
MPDQIEIDFLVEKVALFNDQDAYKKLFFIFFTDLKKFSFSFVKSNDIADEIVSDVFVNLWKNRMRLLEIESLKVYLYVAVKNLSIRYLSRNANHINLISLDDLSVELHTENTRINPEDIFISSEMASAIHSAIERLPPRCKIIYKLIREDGLSYKEVAKILHISVKTIDAQLCIATKKICQSINFIKPVNKRR